MGTKTVRYVIEVYEPGEHTTAAVVFELPSPAASIAVGDLLDPAVWPEAKNLPLQGCFLEVVRVIHVISRGADEVVHKTCLVTDKVPRAAAMEGR